MNFSDQPAVVSAPAAGTDLLTDRAVAEGQMLPLGSWGAAVIEQADD